MRRPCWNTSTTRTVNEQAGYAVRMRPVLRSLRIQTMLTSSDETELPMYPSPVFFVYATSAVFSFEGQELGWSNRNVAPGVVFYQCCALHHRVAEMGRDFVRSRLRREETKGARPSRAAVTFGTARMQHKNIQGGRVRPSQAAAVAAGRPSTEPTSGTDSAVSDTMLQVAAKAALPSECTE